MSVYGFRQFKDMAQDIKTELESVTLIDKSTLAFDNVEVYAGTDAEDIFDLLVDLPADSCLVFMGESDYDKESKRNIKSGVINIIINGEFSNRSVDDEFGASDLMDSVVQWFLPGESTPAAEKNIKGVIYRPLKWGVIQGDGLRDMILLELEFIQNRIKRDRAEGV